MAVVDRAVVAIQPRLRTDHLDGHILRSRLGKRLHARPRRGSRARLPLFYVGPQCLALLVNPTPKLSIGIVVHNTRVVCTGPVRDALAGRRVNNATVGAALPHPKSRPLLDYGSLLLG